MVIARVLALLSLLAVGAIFLASLPDLVRYLRMRSM